MTPDTLHEEPTSAREIADLWSRYQEARQDADVAAQSVDGRYTDAYTAAFLLAKIAVRASGHRVRGGENHKDTYLVLPWLMGSGVQTYVDILDKARAKRNRVMYDGAGMVDEGGVAKLIDVVDAFEVDVRSWLANNHPELT